MPDHIQYEDDELFNPETHHEHSDVPIRPLLTALVIFIVFAIATHFTVKFMYDRFSAAESKRMDAPQTQVARPVDAGVPKNQPLLQPFPRQEDLTPNRQTPVVDLIAMRAAEDKVLHSYGWTDEKNGIVHIPIDQAKALIVEKLAAQSGPPASSPAPSGPLASSPAGTAASPPPSPGGNRP